MSKARDRRAAAEYVLHDMQHYARVSRQRAREMANCEAGDAYRREIARLWGVAKRAAEKAAAR